MALVLADWGHSCYSRKMTDMNSNLSDTRIGRAGDVFLGVFALAVLGGIAALITFSSLAG